jgi:hypothetical protein
MASNILHILEKKKLFILANVPKTERPYSWYFAPHRSCPYCGNDRFAVGRKGESKKTMQNATISTNYSIETKDFALFVILSIKKGIRILGGRNCSLRGRVKRKNTLCE